MKRTKRLSLAVIALSSIALLSACGGSAEENTPNNIEQQVAPTQEAVVERVQSQTHTAAEEKLGLSNEQKFTDDNFLIVDGTKKLTIDAYGTLEKDSNGKYAAEGEVFHAINIQLAGEETLPKYESPLTDVSIDVDGSTVVTGADLSNASSLLISAKPDSAIVVKIQTDGVTQEIDFKTGKRLTMDVAQGWYLPANGQITDGKIDRKVTAGNTTGKMSASFKKATRTAWTEEDGWADAGKASWVFIESDLPKWEFNNASDSDQVHEVWLEDSKGEKYESESETEWGFDMRDETTLKFEVPSSESKFTIHTKNSTDLLNTGEKIGSIKEFGTKSALVFK